MSNEVADRLFMMITTPNSTHQTKVMEISAKEAFSANGKNAITPV